jgi:hypothetical protein
MPPHKHTSGAGDPRPPAPDVSTSIRYLTTDQAAQRFAELGELEGWSWWWVGSGTTAQLIGYHYDSETGMDLLYIDSSQQASVTRTSPSGELQIHRCSVLTSVLRDLGYSQRMR